MGFIYKITNICNNKVYIGQTSRSIEERFNGHLHAAKSNSSFYLHNAMRKYGFENFKVEKIEECEDILLGEKEKYWIQYYNSFENGYNMTLGGEGALRYNYKEIADKYLELQSEKKTKDFFNCSNYVVQQACKKYNIKIKKGLSQEYWESEEGKKRKEKLRELGKKTKGRVVSEETRKKQSEAKKGKYVGEKSPMYGKKFSPEHRQKLIENSAWAKPVKCIETGELFSSALQASKAVGLKTSSNISKVCNGQRKTAGGFHWMFVKEGENDY